MGALSAPWAARVGCVIAFAIGIAAAAEPKRDTRAPERRAMVQDIRAIQGAAVPIGRGVLDAMRRVPRHAFVPPAQRAFAYENRPLPIGYGQTISQPTSSR